MRLRRAGATTFPFDELSGVHFARFVLLSDSLDPAGALIPASLMFISEIDAPLDRHLDELAGSAGPAIDATFGLCDGYPSLAGPAASAFAARRSYLTDRLIEPKAMYVHTVGRTVEQIRQESRAARRDRGVSRSAAVVSAD